MSNSAPHFMRGVWTALITPFKTDGSLDLDAFRGLLAEQKAAGVAGVIPCGTTGESPTLTRAEKETLIRESVSVLKGSATRVVAGTGSNDTRETVELSKWAAQNGVDGILVVTPYYNKPTQSGLLTHFRAVADAVSCDVMLYNVPGRTGITLTPETIVELAKHPRIRAIKEATGNVGFTSEIIAILGSTRIQILSGDDATYFPLLAVGACGVVSVASNLFPRGMVAIQSAVDRGDYAEARRLHDRFFPLFRDLFVEANPIPIKAAMSHQGWCGPQLRHPLTEISAGARAKLMQAMQACGIEGARSAQ